MHKVMIQTDIENALATGSYPKKLSYKLILRKGYSYKGKRHDRDLQNPMKYKNV